MKTKLEHVTELITPAKAEKYLNDNRSNRSLRPGVAEKYEADMKAGNWTQCIMPIAFYEDGDVADGQHRLWAVVASGIAQTFIVVRGVKREDGLNIDTGYGRTLVDNARISGADTGLSHMLIAVCKAIEIGEKTYGGNTNAERMAFVDKHRQAGEWALSNGPKGVMIRNSIALAALGRAWYHEGDKDRLKQFCNVLSTGFMDGEKDIAAVALRNYMLGGGMAARSELMWRPAFFKAQNAIWYFMRGKPLKVIKQIDEERYPLIGGQTIKVSRRGNKLRALVKEKKEAAKPAPAAKKTKPLAGPDKFEQARRAAVKNL